MQKSAQTHVERYGLRDSPLFKLTTQKKLANALKLSKRDLQRLVSSVEDDPARWYSIGPRQAGKKVRMIECPTGKMRGLHERVKRLLGRIQLPSYLMSPRSGRSVATNASAHRAADQLLKMDIKDYYPSTSRELVFQLFHHRFAMAVDVAGLLGKLLTVNGHVPTGSPASPALAFWASRSAFDAIDSYARERGLFFSLWVDDLVISGPKIDRKVARWVRAELQRLGYRCHKLEFQTRRRGFIVTGLRIDRRGLSPHNDTNLKIRDGLRQLGSEIAADEREQIISRLIGLNGHRLSAMGPQHPNIDRTRSLQLELIRRRRELRIQRAR